MPPCIDLDDVYTIKELVRMFRDDPGPLFDKPRDIVTMYYFSSVVYYDYFIVNGLFGPRVDNVKVNLQVMNPLVMMIEHKDIIIIAIRGTKTARDILVVDSQLSIKQDKSLPPNLVSRVHDEYITFLYSTTHGGIARHALECMSMIIDLLSKKKGKNQEIRVYGHSMGAACGIIVAQMLQTFYSRRVACYCLSCPTVFKPDFSDHVESFEYMHYYTKGDPIVEKSKISGRLRCNEFGKPYEMYGRPSENSMLPLPRIKDDISLYAHTVYYAESDIIKPRKNKRIILAKDAQVANLVVGCHPTAPTKGAAAPWTPATRLA